MRISGKYKYIYFWEGTEGSDAIKIRVEYTLTEEGKYWYITRMKWYYTRLLYIYRLLYIVRLCACMCMVDGIIGMTAFLKTNILINIFVIRFLQQSHIIINISY